MSQRATNKKTPHRTPSIDPSEKIILHHICLRDVPALGKTIGVSSTDNQDSVVFVCGSKLDSPDQLIYASFKEAAKFGSFKKYLHKFLIPCYSRKWGQKGLTNIYNGKSDYTILDEEYVKEVAEEEDVQVIEEIHHGQNLMSRKRGHEDDEIQALPSVSRQNTSENDNEVRIPSPKRQRMRDETNEKFMFARSEPVRISSELTPISINTAQSVQPPSPSNFTPIAENDQNEPSGFTPIPEDDEQPSPSYSIPITENDQQEPSGFTPNPKDDEQPSPSYSIPNSSHASIPLMDASELEEQQQLEQIKNTRSLFDFSKSEEKFIQDHMFDPSSKELALGAAGIDPHDVPACLIQHMKPTFFSTPQNLHHSM
uniref:Uncharacterized protein n=1 Tax=Panagrolaimus sp. PS1159 TaxID=55785 RepID=A0AC35FNC2_9BILA